MSNTRDLVDAILSGNTLDAMNAFEEVIGNKAAEGIDSLKADVTADMFQTEEHTDEQLESIKEELIAELSGGTLVNYIKKASTSAAHSAHVSGRVGKKSEPGEYHEKIRNKRLNGIKKAADKLAKEQAEQVYQAIEDVEIEQIAEELIQEIGKGTLASYIKKASGNAAANAELSNNLMHLSHREREAGLKNSSEKKAKAAQAKSNIAFKRLDGIKKAVDKLAKEQAEQVLAIMEELNAD